MILALAVLLVAILILLVRCIVIVPQSNAFVVERLGVYKTTWEAGLHLRTPFIERVARRVSLKEEAADFQPQPVITRDNVTMMIDTVVFFQVFDAKLYAYGVSRPIQAIENLSATTLRDIIGSMTLDETLTSRDTINSRITASLDESTDRWGIKVNRVELKNIEPPLEIRQAMEKQMKADREKRASILLAEGEKQAAITRAEGEKESAILRAEAVKQQRIREAEGEAQALLTVQKAQADAIRMINEAAPSQSMLALRSMEAMEKVADGQATKLIVPSDMQNLAATVASIQEIAGGTAAK
ncbi:MAG TPA: SPFH/Band 7/PHB domain protein [Candidatus Gemmiger excrementipullorum]|uniref:SPFH/Band 7/PHB domain protein n=1 Tax=Candidatus Gemmiger excrementipullorum TaxID=2838610 RepID=A0A9D1Y1W4_9FIRM|nr:SPFH/Band 7/PHB domain protein [Candidatus Gemmiger excrementipullorum]